MSKHSHVFSSYVTLTQSLVVSGREVAIAMPWSEMLGAKKLLRRLAAVSRKNPAKKCLKLEHLL